MDYQINWTEPAQWDLHAIWSYIAADNLGAADKLRASIFRQVDLLEHMPRLGPRFKGHARGEVRHLVVGNYRIFYEVLDNLQRIDIVAVRHAARRDPSFD